MAVSLCLIGGDGMSEDESRRSLDDLGARLQRARDKERPEAEGSGSILQMPTSGLGVAFRIGVELVSALVVGVGIGLLLDRWLGTAPWFFVGFFFLGAGAGILNVYRAASGLGMAAGYLAPEENAAGRKIEENNDESA